MGVKQGLLTGKITPSLQRTPLSFIKTDVHIKVFIEQRGSTWVLNKGKEPLVRITLPRFTFVSVFIVTTTLKIARH